MKRILTSIWFLALIIAIPVIIFLPNLFTKYKANLLWQEVSDASTSNIYFEDLDGNGSREKISCHENSVNKLAFQLYTSEGAVKNQQNFNHNFHERLGTLYFGDVNNNKKLEIYGFTINDDSLFLNWIEPSIANHIQKSKFISKIGTFDEGKIDISIQHFEVVDLEHNNKNEILISIEAGYSIHPRILLIYKPDEDRIIQSADVGINSYLPFLYDLNGDGKFEIITSSAASDNLFSATGISGIDDRPWLQVFNCDLDYFFKPVSFSKGLSNTTRTFITKDGKNDIVVFNCNRSREREKIIQLYKFDKKGNRTDSTYLSEYGKEFNFDIYPTKTDFLLFAGDEILRINNELKVLHHKKITPSAAIVAFDTIKGHSQPFYIARTHLDNELIIYSEEFDEDVQLLFENERIKSVKTKTHKGFDSFFVRTNRHEYYYKFVKNRLYLLKYPMFFLVYLFSVLFIWLIQKIREKQLTEKFELQNQIKDMELRLLKGQMDPHFMFNTFTAIASLLKKEEQDEAYNAFMKFSKLIRSNFNFANNITRPLKEEISAVNYFLEINKMRFKEKLQYSIFVSKDVPQLMLVPKMMIQIHIENALKHGIANLKSEGKIEIGIRRDGEFAKIEIQDNGIGRQNASKLNRPSTKQGLKMLRAIYERLNRENKLKIIQRFVDLKDENGNATGTLVEILLPFDLKE